MGILVNKGANILEQNGFKHQYGSVTGEIQGECYEKLINLFPKKENPDWMYAAVSTETSEVVLYIEDDCESEIETQKFTLKNSFDENEKKFFNEFDNEVSRRVNEYRRWHGHDYTHDDDVLEP